MRLLVLRFSGSLGLVWGADQMFEAVWCWLRYLSDRSELSMQYGSFISNAHTAILPQQKVLFPPESFT
jgi:hypothetical protein